MGTPTDLADIREQIDALDSQMRDLLRARAGHEAAPRQRNHKKGKTG